MGPFFQGLGATRPSDYPFARRFQLLCVVEFMLRHGSVSYAAGTKCTQCLASRGKIATVSKTGVARRSFVTLTQLLCFVLLVVRVAAIVGYTVIPPCKYRQRRRSYLPYIRAKLSVHRYLTGFLRVENKELGHITQPIKTINSGVSVH